MATVPRNRKLDVWTLLGSDPTEVARNLALWALKHAEDPRAEAARAEAVRAWRTAECYFPLRQRREEEEPAVAAAIEALSGVSKYADILETLQQRRAVEPYVGRVESEVSANRNLPLTWLARTEARLRSAGFKLREIAALIPDRRQGSPLKTSLSPKDAHAKRMDARIASVADDVNAEIANEKQARARGERLRAELPWNSMTLKAKREAIKAALKRAQGKSPK